MKQKIRVTRDDVAKAWESFYVEGKSPQEFFDFEGEVVGEKIEIVPSGRIDYCSQCGNEHGYDCPLDKQKPQKIEKLDENLYAPPVFFNGEYHYSKDPVKVVINQIIDVINNLQGI